MQIRKTATTAIAGFALTVAALAAPADAASRSDATAEKRWHSTGQTFYWYESCAAAGRAGVKSGWEGYDCKGSSAPWSRYGLWGLW